MSQSYEFDTQAEAEAFVAGLYEKLTPDADWSMLAGPGAVMADTVDDVVRYLGDHSDQRTSFQGELRLEGKVDLEPGAFEVNVSGEAGARYDFDTSETTLFVGGSASGSIDLPSAGDGTTGNAELSAELEVELVYDEHGNVSSLDLGGRSAARVGRASRRTSTAPAPARRQPESLSLSAAGGADVRFDASIDLQDPIVRSGRGPAQRHEQRRRSRRPTSRRCCGIGGAGADRRRAGSSDERGTSASPASRRRDHQRNAFTWVKPPGGDFTLRHRDELREDRSHV